MRFEIAAASGAERGERRPTPQPPTAPRPLARFVLSGCRSSGGGGDGSSSIHHPSNEQISDNCSAARRQHLAGFASASAPAPGPSSPHGLVVHLDVHLLIVLIAGVRVLLWKLPILTKFRGLAAFFKSKISIYSIGNYVLAVFKAFYPEFRCYTPFERKCVALSRRMLRSFVHLFTLIFVNFKRRILEE